MRNPFVHGSLTAKARPLFGYVLLGSDTLKRGSSHSVRLVCWLTALATLMIIISIARTHHPLGVLAVRAA